MGFRFPEVAVVAVLAVLQRMPQIKVTASATALAVWAASISPVELAKTPRSTPLFSAYYLSRLSAVPAVLALTYQLLR